MRLIFLLIILIILLLVGRLFLFGNIEGFDDSTTSNAGIPLDPDFIKTYGTFKKFYNAFMNNWQMAITTSVVADIPQKPLSSPKDVINATASPPTPSQSDMNKYVITLSQQLNKPLPQVTIPLPDEINSSFLQQLQTIVPDSSSAYQNALDWMNTQLSNAHANLASALQGIPAEGFEDVCQDFSQCMSDPDFVQRFNEQILKAQQAKLQTLQQLLANKMNAINTNSTLQSALAQNNKLIEQSKGIQKSAQNGDLLKQINIPSGPENVYTMPAGGDTLSKLQKTDPAKYNKLKNSGGLWFAVKQLMEQINSNI